MLSIFLCCAAIFAVATALPTGAPAAVCDTLTPAGPHADGIVEQPTLNPWTIDICDFDEIMGFYMYTPGATYNSKLIVCLKECVVLVILHVGCWITLLHQHLWRYR